MTAFHSRQSDWRRRVCKKANASTLQICTTNRTTKLQGHVHEGQKISRNNLSSAVQVHVMELPLYAKHALPLIFIRLSRLANSSPTNRRSPARRSRNGCEPSHKSSGEMSPSLPHNFPAIAGRWKSQCRRISARATRETTRNTARNRPAAAVSQSEQQTMKHPAKHLTRRLVEVLTSRFNHDAQQL
jgi:hypothetical protein